MYIGSCRISSERICASPCIGYTIATSRNLAFMIKGKTIIGYMLIYVEKFAPIKLAPILIPIVKSTIAHSFKFKYSLLHTAHKYNQYVKNDVQIPNR